MEETLFHEEKPSSVTRAQPSLVENSPPALAGMTDIERAPKQDVFDRCQAFWKVLQKIPMVPGCRLCPEVFSICLVSRVRRSGSLPRSVPIHCRRRALQVVPGNDILVGRRSNLFRRSPRWLTSRAQDGCTGWFWRKRHNMARSRTWLQSSTNLPQE